MKRRNFLIFIISFAASTVLWVLAFIFPQHNFWAWYLSAVFVIGTIYTIVTHDEEYFEEMRILGVVASLLIVLAVKWLFKL